MALDVKSLLTAGVVFLMAAHAVPVVDGCDSVLYKELIDDFCLTRFQFDMESLDPKLWCSWKHTLEVYGDLTNCTYLIALKMNCFWPNQIIDNFFMEIHRQYFHDCALTGRLLHDPPISILAPFIAVPVLVTLLVTTLVVWRSKRSEGVL